MNKIKLLLLLLSLIMIVSCRGWRSEKPPVHLNPNMDFNPKYKAQSNPYDSPTGAIPWGDHHSFSKPNERGDIIELNTVLHDGKNDNGTWVKRIPFEVNYSFMHRGRERYEIYCTPCHGADGSGRGSVTQRGWFMPAKYWEPRILAYTDGELYDIVKNGKNSMPGYWKQIEMEDRWKIVAYIRALQKSHTSNINDVPEERRAEIVK